MFMRKEYLEKLPNWSREIDKDNNFLVLSDDIDSFFSCAILNMLFGVEIQGFYNFEGVYKNPNTYLKDKKPIWVDADVTKGCCFGNHETYIRNKNAVNLNNFNNGSYTDKYAGSTVLTVLSVYGVDISKYTEEQLMFLLAIDVAFKGAYSSRFRPTWEKWIDILDFPILKELVNKHTISEFYNIISKYNLNENIYVDANGKLNTQIKIKEIRELFPDMDFKLGLGQKQFVKIKNLKNIYSGLFDIKHNKNQIFSSARTYKYSLSYSIVEEVV